MVHKIFGNKLLHIEVPINDFRTPYRENKIRNVLVLSKKCIFGFVLKRPFIWYPYHGWADLCLFFSEKLRFFRIPIQWHGIMASKVISVIIMEIKTLKYYSIIIDSTPAILHVDQLSFIFKYVQPDWTPAERFIKFIWDCGHKALVSVHTTCFHCYVIAHP